MLKGYMHHVFCKTRIGLCGVTQCAGVIKKNSECLFFGDADTSLHENLFMWL